MFTFQTSLRVRYAETDKMGYVYYGNYATYFEVARVEALRSLGINYKEREDKGVMLPRTKIVLLLGFYVIYWFYLSSLPFLLKFEPQK